MPGGSGWLPETLPSDDDLSWKGGGSSGSGDGLPVDPGGGPFVPADGPYIDLLAQALGQPDLAPGVRRRLRGGQGVMQAGSERVPIPRYMFGSGMDQQQMLQDVPAYEFGTHPGGPAIVGEQGPEMVNLPGGSAVIPNPDTIASMLIRILGGLMGLDGQPGGEMGEPTMGGPPAYKFGTRGIEKFKREHPDLKPRNAPPPPGQGPGSGANDPNPNPGEHNYGDLPFDALLGPDGKINWPAFINAIMRSGIEGGAFNAMGSRQVANLAGESITKSGGARERAATLGADMDSGGDPALQAYARTRSRLDTQGGSADAYAKALADSALQNQAFIQSLAGGPVAGATVRKDPKEPNPWMGIIGGVGSAIVPGLFGRGGGMPGGGGAQTGGEQGGGFGDVPPQPYANGIRRPNSTWNV